MWSWIAAIGVLALPTALFTALLYIAVGPGDFWSGAVCGAISLFASANIIEAGMKG